MKKENTDEKEVQKEANVSSYAWIIGFCFSGAFLIAVDYFNQGTRIDYPEMLLNISCGAIMSLALGFSARFAFHTANETSSRTLGKGAFIVALALSVFLPTLTAGYISGRHREFDCRICSAGIESDSIEYENGMICRTCFYNGIIAGELGFCEACQSAAPVEDMESGFCENCRDPF